MIKYDVYLVDLTNPDNEYLLDTFTDEMIAIKVALSIDKIRKILKNNEIDTQNLGSNIHESIKKVNFENIEKGIEGEEKSMKTEYDVYVVDINNNEVLVDTFDNEDVAINVSRSIRKLKDLLDKDYLPQTNILSAYYERVKDKEV